MATKSKKRYGKDERLANVVQLFEAKSNKMFPDWLTALVRFLRYTTAVKCASCGKRSKHHWTLLCEFTVAEMGMLVATPGKTPFPPMTPCCRDHLMQPTIITVTPKS